MGREGDAALFPSAPRGALPPSPPTSSLGERRLSLQSATASAIPRAQRDVRSASGGRTTPASSIAASIGQYSSGSGVDPSVAPSHVQGSAMPAALISKVVVVRARIARLSPSGHACPRRGEDASRPSPFRAVGRPPPPWPALSRDHRDCSLVSHDATRTAISQIRRDIPMLGYSSRPEGRFRPWHPMR